MILDHFDRFGIVADDHNAPIEVFSSLNMFSYVRNRFSDPENLCLDLLFTSLGGILSILNNFDCFGIMADAHNVLMKILFFITQDL